MITPTDTTMNAVNVPIDTMSARLSNGTNAANNDAAIATSTVLFTGVMVRGLTAANQAGSRPSRPIANRMRVMPYSVTSVTVKIEITAPAANIVLAHLLCVTLSRMVASPAFSCAAKLCQGWVPSAATATSTYTLVTIISAETSARGMVFWGSLTSSPAV